MCGPRAAPPHAPCPARALQHCTALAPPAPCSHCAEYERAIEEAGGIDLQARLGWGRATSVATLWRPAGLGLLRPAFRALLPAMQRPMRQQLLSSHRTRIPPRLLPRSPHADPGPGPHRPHRLQRARQQRRQPHAPHHAGQVRPARGCFRGLGGRRGAGGHGSARLGGVCGRRQAHPDVPATCRLPPIPVPCRIARVAAAAAEAPRSRPPLNHPLAHLHRQGHARGRRLRLLRHQQRAGAGGHHGHRHHSAGEGWADGPGCV